MYILFKKVNITRRTRNNNKGNHMKQAISLLAEQKVVMEKVPNQFG